MTTAIRKMALVPAELAHAQQVAEPTRVQLNLLDEEMKKVLDSTFPADVKFKLYNHILHQHGEMSDELKKPVKVEIKEEVVTATKEKTQLPIERLMRGMPEKKKRSANLLLDHLTEGSITFNDRNELVSASGEAVDGSNLIDLFHYANRDLSRTPPPGWEQFRHMLYTTNAPTAAISNRNLYKTPQRGRGVKWESLY